MKLRAEQLPAHLKQKLSPVYVLSGDEPLLIQELADTIRATAALHGFSERELFHADAQFDWSLLLAEANSLSLFAEKKILEVRLPSGKPGDKGRNALLEYTKNPSSDNLLLVILPKLDAATQKSKWLQTLESTGCLIQAWPVSPQQMPRWISDRFNQKGLSISPDAAQLLAERSQGNLLAAAQEVEKLALLVTEKQIDLSTLAAATADQARYDIFQLSEACLNGNSRLACQIVRGLLQEGTDPLQILWVLSKDVRILNEAQSHVENGRHPDWALKQERVWDKQLPLYRNALSRLSKTGLKLLAHTCQHLDLTVKGMHKGTIENELAGLALGIVGKSAINNTNLWLTVNQ